MCGGSARAQHREHAGIRPLLRSTDAIHLRWDSSAGRIGEPIKRRPEHACNSRHQFLNVTSRKETPRISNGSADCIHRTRRVHHGRVFYLQNYATDSNKRFCVRIIPSARPSANWKPGVSHHHPGGRSDPRRDLERGHVQGFASKRLCAC